MCVGKNTAQARSSGICAPLAHKLCAQQTAILLSGKNFVFPDKLKQPPEGDCFLLSVSKKSFLPAA